MTPGKLASTWKEVENGVRAKGNNITFVLELSIYF